MLGQVFVAANTTTTPKTICGGNYIYFLSQAHVNLLPLIITYTSNQYIYIYIWNSLPLLIIIWTLKKFVSSLQQQFEKMLVAAIVTGNYRMYLKKRDFLIEKMFAVVIVTVNYYVNLKKKKKKKRRFVYMFAATNWKNVYDGNCHH